MTETLVCDAQPIGGAVADGKVMWSGTLYVDPSTAGPVTIECIPPVGRVWLRASDGALIASGDGALSALLPTAYYMVGVTAHPGVTAEVWVSARPAPSPPQPQPASPPFPIDPTVGWGPEAQDGYGDAPDTPRPPSPGSQPPDDG